MDNKFCQSTCNRSAINKLLQAMLTTSWYQFVVTNLLQHLNKLVETTLNVFYLTRSVYPDVQIRKLNVANQQLYALVGLRRKLPPGQYFMQAPVPQGSRLPQGGAPPQLRQSRTASPPMTMDASHVPRTPTPPIRTEGLVTNVPTLPQSPSLPGQSHDVMFPNARSSQPGNFQLPTRPPATSGPAPPPSVMSASEFLGSLVGTRPLDSTRNSSTADIPSAPSNLSSSSSQTPASSNVTSKIIGARVPDLVAGSAGPVVTSSSKTDDHPKARMSDVVSGAAGMANGGVSQAKKADQASLIKSSASLNNVSSRELPGAARKFVIVNGTVEEAKVLKSNAVVVNSSQAKLPTVNG